MDLQEIDRLEIKRNDQNVKTKMTMGEKIKSRVNQAFHTIIPEKQEKKINNDVLPIDNRIYTLKDSEDKPKWYNCNKEKNKERWGDRFICCSKKDDKLNIQQCASIIALRAE